MTNTKNHAPNLAGILPMPARFALLALFTLLAPAPRAGEELVETRRGDSFSPKRVEATPERIQRLKVPEGFKVNVFAKGLDAPRMMAVGPEGTLYITRPGSGDVIALTDTNGDGVAEQRAVVVKDLARVHGIAIREGKMVLCTIGELYAAELRGTEVGQPQKLVDDIPRGGGHTNRTIGFDPQGRLYISVGSTCNCCVEDNPEHATILRLEPDGRRHIVFARGLRNTVGFAWHPQTGEMWGMDHGSDWLGNDEPPEELNRLIEGKHYGWPFVYADRRTFPNIKHPGIENLQPFAAGTEPCALPYQAHSAPLQMVFYNATQFPPDCKGDAFVAMHGSWNRNPAVGYEVVRIRFSNGRPERFEPFMTGFLIDGTTFFGRPAGLAVARDGALLVGDDHNGVVYRIAYAGGARPGGEPAPFAPGGAPMKPVAGPPDRPTLGQAGETPKPVAIDLPATSNPNATRLEVSSESFQPQSTIPDQYSGFDTNKTPPLAWSGVPQEAKSLTLIVEDPDAPTPRPFVHWLLYNIPASVKSLPESLSDAAKLDAPAGAMQGRNGAGQIGYIGPRPPKGPVHHYYFQLFALDTPLNLEPGATREELLAAIKGHVIAKGALVGLYQRQD